MEELGLWFPEAETPSGLPPEGTDVEGQPVVLSASIEVGADGRGALVVDVEGTFASASIHLVVGNSHVVFPVKTDSTEYENPVLDVGVHRTNPAFSASWDLSCLDAADPECFPQCVEACTAPEACRQWMCLSTDYTDGTPEVGDVDPTCLDELAAGIAHTSGHEPSLSWDFYENGCVRYCSMVVGMLHYYDAGQLREPLPDSSARPEFEAFTARLYDVLTLAGSPEGFAASLPQRRAAEEYCPYTAEVDWATLWGYSSSLLGTSLEDSACPTTEKVKKYFACMVTGELPQRPAADPPVAPGVPKRRRRISSPCAMFKDLPTDFPPAMVMAQFDPLPGSPVPDMTMPSDGLESATISTSPNPDWSMPY